MISTIQALLVRFLRWTERYVKTDMVYLAHGGFWVIAGQAVSSGSVFLLAVAFANLVPAEVYGTYKYILSVAGIFAIFALPGMNTALMQTTARGEDATIYAVTRARVLYASLGSIFAAIGSAYYLYNGNIQLSVALFIIAATLPFFDTVYSYPSYLVGKRRFDLRAKYHAIVHVTSMLSVIATIFFTDHLAYILLAYFVPLIVVRGLLHRSVTRSIPNNATSEQNAEVTRYGKHLTAMQILSMVANEIDKVIIWKFLGPVHVAIYTFSLAVPEQIKGPLKGVGELAFPKFAAQSTEQIQQNLPALWRKIGLYALALLGISFLYILIAPYLFAFVFPGYMESVKYSQLYALTMVTNVTSIPLAILGAQKRTRTQYLISTVQPIVTIGLLLALVPLYGIMGAIVALMLSKFTTVGISLGSLFTLK
jgi:O-antigen/teichoic acid export membrane protein